MKYALKNMQVCIKNNINMLKNMPLKMLINAFVFKKNHKTCNYNTNMLQNVYIYIYYYLFNIRVYIWVQKYMKIKKNKI